MISFDCACVYFTPRACSPSVFFFYLCFHFTTFSLFILRALFARWGCDAGRCSDGRQDHQGSCLPAAPVSRFHLQSRAEVYRLPPCGRPVYFFFFPARELDDVHGTVLLERWGFSSIRTSVHLLSCRLTGPLSHILITSRW